MNLPFSVHGSYLTPNLFDWIKTSDAIEVVEAIKPAYNVDHVSNSRSTMIGPWSCKRTFLDNHLTNL